MPLCVRSVVTALRELITPDHDGSKIIILSYGTRSLGTRVSASYRNSCSPVPGPAAPVAVLPIRPLASANSFIRQHDKPPRPAPPRPAPPVQRRVRPPPSRGMTRGTKNTIEPINPVRPPSLGQHGRPGGDTVPFGYYVDDE